MCMCINIYIYMCVFRVVNTLKFAPYEHAKPPHVNHALFYMVLKRGYIYIFNKGK